MSDGPPDVFVSYAHADNDLLFGAKQGWVTNLVNNLRGELRKKGFRDLNVWIDHKLKGNVQLTPTLMDLVHSSATMLIIMSEAYLASGWCQREFTTFVKNQAATSRRVFVVFADNINREKLPEDLQDLIGYNFWVQDEEGEPERRLGAPEPYPSDLSYYKAALRVAKDLRDVLGVEFSPDGQRILTGSEDKTARLWRCEECVALPELLKLAEQRVTRQLTDEERQLYLYEE